MIKKYVQCTVCICRCISYPQFCWGKQPWLCATDDSRDAHPRGWGGQSQMSQIIDQDRFVHMHMFKKSPHPRTIGWHDVRYDMMFDMTVTRYNSKNAWYDMLLGSACYEIIRYIQYKEMTRYGHGSFPHPEDMDLARRWLFAHLPSAAIGAPKRLACPGNGPRYEIL